MNSLADAISGIPDNLQWTCVSNLTGGNGDIDLVLAPDDFNHLPRLLSCPNSSNRWLLANCITHEKNAHYYPCFNDRGEWIAFDACTDYRRDGMIWMRWQRLVRGRRKESGVWVPTPEAYFEYLLIKRSLKLRIDPDVLERLACLRRQAPASCDSVAQRYLGRKLADEFLKDLRAPERWDTWSRRERELRQAILRRRSHQPLRRLSYLWGECQRIALRVLQPTGLMVALIGPDGVGKTSIARALAARVRGAFRGTAYCHWRPSPFRRLANDFPVGGALTDHEERAPGLLGRIFSIVRLGYSSLIFVTGHLTRILPAKVASKLVVCDRYNYAYLVRPESERYYGPQWLARAAVGILPKPDITLFLSAAPGIIRRRKPELNEGEINRQLSSIRLLARHDSRIVEIDASGNMEEVASRVADALSQHLAQRTSHRLGRDYGFRVISLAGVERIAIPVRPKRARRQALSLYIPTRRLGRFMHAAMRVFPGIATWILGCPRLEPGTRLGHWDLYGWLAELEKQLSLSRLIPAFYYPHHHSRQKAGVLLMDSDGRRVGFSKIAWDEGSRDELAREAEGLRFVRGLEPACFQAPQILSSGEWEGRAYALYSPLPDNLKPAPIKWNRWYQAACCELRQKTQVQRVLSELAWWPSVRSVGGIWVRLAEYLESAEPAGGYEFSATHGDLAPWNARMGKGGIWLFDWEYFASEAPACLDPVHFELRRYLHLDKVPLKKLMYKLIRLLASFDNMHEPTLQIALVLSWWKATSYPLDPVLLDSLAQAIVEG